jgi:hypothetical protein
LIESIEQVILGRGVTVEKDKIFYIVTSDPRKVKRKLAWYLYPLRVQSSDGLLQYTRLIQGGYMLNGIADSDCIYQMSEASVQASPAYKSNPSERT